jgi:glycosyltransferase involved in cell wall biosynthesis
MGYTENCLPRSLAKLGHEVHVITSNYNIYGNADDYNENYQDFLGDAIQPCGTLQIDGYTVHRLSSRSLMGYIQIKGLAAKLFELRPAIVHSVAIASVQTYLLAAIKLFTNFKLFAENHQHLSVVRPFLLKKELKFTQRFFYWMTRTLPTSLASFAVERCYAVAPDCLEVANRFYGVSKDKLMIQSLGTDTDIFHPAVNSLDVRRRQELRTSLGILDSDLVCVYTGRFTEDKNPALLARAIELISNKNNRWKAIFVGEGIQKQEIENCNNCQVISFMKHTQLADLYRAMDIAVWPRQESMSMLDAASCGLPLIVADSIGENKRVKGNGITYPENNLLGLVSALELLEASDVRQEMGRIGRVKMVNEFSWDAVALRYVNDYEKALAS